MAGGADGQLQGEGMRDNPLSIIYMRQLRQSFLIWGISSHVQVLIYSGQLDVIVAAPLTERFLPTVNWTGAAEYKTAPRFHWKVQPSDTEVAGYVKQVKEFYQVSRKHLKLCQEVTLEHFCQTKILFSSLFHPGYHPGRWTHSALRPTSEVV